MAAYDSALRTQTLARVVGPYLAVIAAAVALRAGDMALLLPAFMQDAALVFTGGAFTLMVGLTIFAAHHHFSSRPAFVITLLGCAAALKGATLLLAPELGAPLTAAIARATPVLIAIAAVVFLIGLWLTVVGWFSAAPKTNSKESMT